jgi:hypothetical protein
MSLGDVNLERYPLNVYMQALSHVTNAMIREKLIPGHVETYDYILDLNQKFLSLPITALKDIISSISIAYSMMLGKLYIVNCTSFAKLIYNGIEKMLSEETQAKIKVFSADDVRNGALRRYIDPSVL